MKNKAPVFKSLVCALSLALTVSIPALAASDRPVLTLPSADEIGPRCQQGLSDLGQQISALEKIQPQSEAGAAEFLKGWNRLQIELENLHGPMALLSQVSPDANVRKNADACSMNVQRFITDLFQNEKLYRNMRIMRVNDDEERKLRQDIVSAYEDAGVSLTTEKRNRVKQILARLAEIDQEFSRNIRDNKTKLVFTPEEMQGMSKEYLANIQRDGQGNYLLGFSYPEYIPFMQYADNDKARERYRFAFINRGTSANIQLLQEAVNLRHEMAMLSGYRSYADFALRRRMAKKPGPVNKFLDNVESIVVPAEKKELDELRAFKAQQRGILFSESEIKHWDTNYWQQRVKESRYNIDQNALRQYFPTHASMDWVMGLSSKLYGIEFKKADVPVWHSDVVYYDVIDKASGKQIGGIYLDIFPRDGKYGHAAAFPVQGSSTTENRQPISVLVTNFNRIGLDLDELETMLHEFGHVLHGVLSNTRFVDQSGTSVERDFVEAPSQMYEEWAHNYDALSTLPAYCTNACPAVDRDMLKRLNESRKFGQGILYSRQVLYAKYDMALHSDKPGDVMKTWMEMEGDTVQGYDPGTQFPGQFGHVVGGYSAGYYGYLWSKVLALDMLSRFNGKLMDPQVGQFYRKTILEKGSELPADRMVRYFLGRSPDSTAFYEDISGNAPGKK